MASRRSAASGARTRDGADLERCRADHDAPGCTVEPIEGKAAWLEQAMSARAGQTSIE